MSHLRIKKNIKAHYVTLTATSGFKKKTTQNLKMHVNMSHKTAILLKKLSHILQRKCPGCRTSEGKPEDTFSIKYEPIILKLLFCATYKHASLSFIFKATGCDQSYIVLL